MVKFSFKEVKEAKGDLQGFANRLLLEPIFDCTTWFVANFTRLTANQLSGIGVVFGLIASVAFFAQEFVIGAICYEIMNLFDTFDGRIARLKNQSSKFGTYVDWYFGYWVTFLMFFGLVSGVYFKLNSIDVWFFGFILYFLLTIRFVESNVVGFIMGGQKSYTSKVQEGETKSLLARIRGFLIKKGYREPFNMTDNQHILFFLMPLTGWFTPLYLILVIGIMLNIGIWFINYSTLLKKI